MPSCDNQLKVYTQHRISEGGGGTFHKAPVRINRKMCIQIIRHAKTQNLEIIIFVTLLIS